MRREKLGRLELTEEEGFTARAYRNAGMADAAIEMEIRYQRLRAGVPDDRTRPADGPSDRVMYVVGCAASMALGVAGFRLVYGAWPPETGSLGAWLSSDDRAQLATLVGAGVLVVASIISHVIRLSLRR